MAGWERELWAQSLTISMGQMLHAPHSMQQGSCVSELAFIIIHS